jgi:YVTN family beta-propeller protein
MSLRALSFLSLFSVLSLLVGCDLAGNDATGDTDASITSGVFVANQGAFGQGNGSISVYDPLSDQASSEAITGLSSIVQGIALRNGELYVAANSGGRLDVFSTVSLNPVEQVTRQISSPRYIAFPSDQNAYVSNLFGDISVVDLSSGTVTKTVSTSGSPEGLTVAGDRVYAALGVFDASSKVAVLNANDATLTTEIDIGCTARFVLADDEDEVFALCNNETTGEVVILDGTQEQSRFALSDSVQTAGPGQDAYYSSGTQELYVVLDEDRVVRINTAINQKTTTLTPSGTGPIGAVGYDAAEDRLYLGRADPNSPFSAAGTVTIHRRDGTKVGDFTAGIAPTFIDFRRGEE